MSCQGKPLPMMFVGKENDHTVIGNFMKRKYPALSQLIGKPETTHLQFSAKDFSDLIGTLASKPSAFAVKVYFASYVITGHPPLDVLAQSGYLGEMTLIFVAMDSAQVDIRDYFMISPTGGILNIPKTAFDLMAGSFQSNKLPLLQDIAFASGKPNFHESFSIWYELPKLNGPRGFLGEIACQGAKGVSIYLGAFDRDEKFIVDKVPVDVGWQLTLIFILSSTVSNGGVEYLYHFDIEDSGGFNDRNNDLGNIDLGGGDTGNPCPPAKGCSSSVG